jgi:hypothetical protein
LHDGRPARSRTDWLKLVLGSVSIAIAAFALIALSILLLDVMTRNGWPWFVDWWIYHWTVERALAGQSLFDPRQLTGAYLMTEVSRTGSTYPPASISLLLPFTIGGPGLALYLAASFGLFFSGI